MLVDLVNRTLLNESLEFQMEIFIFKNTTVSKQWTSKI